jgi:hypothetical protein
MANKPIWPGSSSFYTGSTPFGFYDSDSSFQTDANKVAVFCARKLGYPIMEVELQDINFFSCFEEAVTTYGNEVYLMKIRDNYLSLEGSLTGSALNNTVVNPGLANVIAVADNYGQEIGVGGHVEWRSGSVKLEANKQTYDLNQWASASASLQPGDSIRIQRVFYQQTPAIVRYFDPYLGSGYNYQGLMETFGWGSYSPAVSYMMFPLYWDIQRIQAIEMSDQVRRSQFSFELTNNKLKVFPIPGDAVGHMWFEYTTEFDARNPSNGPYSGSRNLVTNVSNVPYANPNYNQINSPGRYWIFEYTAALAKEALAYVRGKYGTIPVPGDETTLNQADLLTDARAEKTALLEKLRGDLDQTTRQSQLERKQAENVAMKSTLDNIPLMIYIG